MLNTETKQPQANESYDSYDTFIRTDLFDTPHSIYTQTWDGFNYTHNSLRKYFIYTPISTTHKLKSNNIYFS